MSIVRWASLPLLCSLLPQSSNHKTERTPLERLQAKIDVLSVPNLTPSEFAGQYTNPSEEQNKRVPPLGSKTLFIFPDETYIFTFKADISPDTISDKGSWSLEGDILQLKSDKDIKWRETYVDRRLIVVRRRRNDNELFLVGIDQQLPYFEKPDDDPEFIFLLVSLKREKTISAEEAKPLRTWDDGSCAFSRTLSS